MAEPDGFASTPSPISDGDSVLFERRGSVAVITLNRPQVRNAINPALAVALERALDELEGDPELRVGVLAATVIEPRPVFCAGNDLSDMDRELADEATTETCRGGFAGIVKYPRTKPLIAAVDGFATSGGLEVVLACDLVVASRRSSFSLAEVKWGLIAGAGGLFRLPWAIGKTAAMHLALTAARIDAERAYQLGLVSTLTDDDVRATAVQEATVIAGYSPAAVTASKTLIESSFGMTTDECWAANADAFSELRVGNELRDGLEDFRREIQRQ